MPAGCHQGAEQGCSQPPRLSHARPTGQAIWQI